MEKQLLFYCIILVMCVACQTEHKHQLKVMNDLLQACEQHDIVPNDTIARAVVFYMERYGSPTEQQQAWRMMAKVYHRQGDLFHEGFAFEMALASIDSTSKHYNPLVAAEILYEASINSVYCNDELLAHWQAERAIQLAREAGDSMALYRYLAQKTAISVEMRGKKGLLPLIRWLSDKLWQNGRKDWSVDAFLPYISFMNNGSMNDSMAMWMKRYEQHTQHDLSNADSFASFAALEYWQLRGKYFMHTGQFDSAHFYFDKMVQHPWNYIRCRGYLCMAALYEVFKEQDTEKSLSTYYLKQSDQCFSALLHNRFQENKKEYQLQGKLIDHELALQQQRTTLVFGLLLLTAICAFILYRYRQLKQQHRETLQENYEYAEVIKNTKHQDKYSLLDTDIAHRFHDLSAQDTHPKVEEWQALKDEIDRLYPQLFDTLQQQYAKHQPGQTLTEQERRAISLLTIRCSPLQISILLVCTKSNVSYLRRRLYYKLTGKDGSGTDLDKYIAQICES